jgi:uncharacterized protein with PQ loop repeat
MLTTATGAMAALFTTVAYVPQLKKCWDTGKAEDFSLKMFSLLASGVGLWVTYGILQHDVVSLRPTASAPWWPAFLFQTTWLEPDDGRLNLHLIQILLPLYDNAGKWFEQAPYSKMQGELAKKFGGLTTFTRVPAQGLWKNEGDTKRDDIVIFEVMAPALDRDWWGWYRSILEVLFRHNHLLEFL